jgi:hypothetical protein
VYHTLVQVLLWNFLNMLIDVCNTCRWFYIFSDMIWSQLHYCMFTLLCLGGYCLWKWYLEHEYCLNKCDPNSFVSADQQQCVINMNIFEWLQYLWNMKCDMRQAKCCEILISFSSYLHNSDDCIATYHCWIVYFDMRKWRIGNHF